MPKRATRQSLAADNKRYRKLYVAAKKKGLVKDRGPAKDFKPTSYMKKRLRQLEPYLGPDYTVARASPELAKAWANLPNSYVPLTFNRKVVVKTEPGVKVSTKGGVLRLRRHLEAGTFEQLPLPVQADNLAEFRQWIEQNPYYNNILKHEDEVFNFRIFGSDSYNSFGDIGALISELEKYENYEPDAWEEGTRFWQHFELFRSYKDWTGSEHAKAKAKHNTARRDEAKRRKIARMSPEEREAYFQRQKDFRNSRRVSQPSYKKQKAAQRVKRKKQTKKQKAAERAKQRDRMRKLRASRKSDS